MDDFWRRELAESKLHGRMPSVKNRIILEGLYDQILLGHMKDSNKYKLCSISSQTLISNKEKVVEGVSHSLKMNTTPPTMGLVDMDGDLSGDSLINIINKYSFPNELSLYIRDSRGKSCLFSLISFFIDEDWKWLEDIQDDFIMPRNWDQEWKLVLKISQFRTSIHMFKQRGEKTPHYIPKIATDHTKRTTSEYTYENWLDLYLDHSKNFENHFVNDHCLEAMVCDYIAFETGNLHQSRKILKTQIDTAIRNALKKKIQSNGLNIGDLLEYVGNPFV